MVFRNGERECRSAAEVETPKGDEEEVSEIVGFGLREPTSVSLISSLSSMPSTTRQPWLMKWYKPGSSFTKSLAGE